jgi:hypothetical protein
LNFTPSLLSLILPPLIPGTVSTGIIFTLFSPYSSSYTFPLNLPLPTSASPSEKIKTLNLKIKLNELLTLSLVGWTKWFFHQIDVSMYLCMCACTCTCVCICLCLCVCPSVCSCVCFCVFAMGVMLQEQRIRSTENPGFCPRPSIDVFCSDAVNFDYFQEKKRVFLLFLC